MPVPGNGKNAVVWSSADKFGMVLETASMNEPDPFEYCRGKRMFVEPMPIGARPASRPIRYRPSATANYSRKAIATAYKSNK
jgi:hypothetical protein